MQLINDLNPIDASKWVTITLWVKKWWVKPNAGLFQPWLKNENNL